MSFELSFTPEAEETYDAVVDQLRYRWGERVAKKFEARVSKSLNTISITPHMYPIVEENMEIRKCILHKNCSLFYKVYDEVILIICFWDNRQEPFLI